MGMSKDGGHWDGGGPSGIRPDEGPSSVYGGSLPDNAVGKVGRVVAPLPFESSGSGTTKSHLRADEPGGKPEPSAPPETVVVRATLTLKIPISRRRQLLADLAMAVPAYAESTEILILDEQAQDGTGL